MSAARFRLLLIPVLTTTILSGVCCSVCPHNCKCYFDFYHCASTSDVNEISIQVHHPTFTLQIFCKDSSLNVNCFNMPNISRQFFEITFTNCHTSILACMRNPHGLNQHEIKDVSLSMAITNDTLLKQHVEDLKFCEKIQLVLGDDIPIPVALFNSLRNLRTIYILSGKLQLSSGKFNSTSLNKVYFIHITMDNLHSEGSFEGLPNLKTLSLEYVIVENIRRGFLSGLHSLQTLRLAGNDLKSIEVGAFTSTPNLRILEIVSNPLVSVPGQLLAKLNFLHALVIERPERTYLNSAELKIDIDAFAQLHALEHITIRYCNLRTRYVNSENSTEVTVTSSSGNQINGVSPVLLTNLNSLKSVTITGNCIAENKSNLIFDNITTLEKLNLSNNTIKELPKNIFSGFSALLYLDLSENYIKVLHDGLFYNLTALKTLNLSNNVIEILTFDVFIGLKSLIELYLQNNNIMNIKHNYFNKSPFRHLSNLKRMDLSNNKLKLMFGPLATDMPHIEYLSVRNNDLSDTWDFQSLYTKKIIRIDLSENKISYAGLSSRISQTNYSQVANRVIIMEHNPFICNCRNYGLYLRSKRIVVQDEPLFILGNTKCSDPANLKGKIIKELSPAEIVCHVESYGCPNNCTCTVIPVTETAVLDCNEMPTTLHFWYDIPFSYFTLNLKTQPHTLLENIRTLNLSNIGLYKIEFNVTDNLEVLDVSHNNLTTIPNTFLNTNITLYVADNPLQCDCSLVKGLKEDRVADYDLVRCADGRQLSEINVTRFCMWKTLLMGYICMGIIVGIFLLKCGLTTYSDMKRKRMNFPTFLFRRGSDYSVNMEMIHDITKDNDLFISFAHEDTEFVRDKLLPKLENDFDQKVCVHHRDWVPGELIDDQIVQSVENSRRTMIILTKAFILSEWSYLEFRTAHNMSIREGKPRVIIVLLDESIVNDERLSREIKSDTSVNTYLVWGDPNFWPKLKRILPKRRR